MRGAHDSAEKTETELKLLSEFCLRCDIKRIRAVYFERRRNILSAIYFPLKEIHKSLIQVKSSENKTIIVKRI